MKKELLYCLLLAFSLSSFGQGEVSFANNSNSRVSTNSVWNGSNTGFISGFGNYYFALFSADSSVTTVNDSSGSVTGLGTYVWNDLAWSFTGNYATNTTSGLFNGNYTSSSGTTVPYPSLGRASFLVVGWSANGGSSVAEIQSYMQNGAVGGLVWIGQSPVGANLLVGGGVATPSIIFGSGGIGAFTLGTTLIPEPSIGALAFLILATAISQRRTKLNDSYFPQR